MRFGRPVLAVLRLAFVRGGGFSAQGSRLQAEGMGRRNEGVEGGPERGPRWSRAWGDCVALAT